MINILWTSGWDSTFRLLDLVINKKVEVQPYYIEDENRFSAKIEIKTMERIRKSLKEQNLDAFY